MLCCAQVWKEAIGHDLMPLVGGTTYENPPEEELAAGVMGKEQLRELFALMKAVMNDGTRREQQLLGRAKHKRLDASWFLTQSFVLLRMIDAALAKHGKIVIGLYE